MDSSEQQLPSSSTSPVALAPFTSPRSWNIQICTEIGGRPRQEDRFFSKPRIRLFQNTERPHSEKRDDQPHQTSAETAPRADIPNDQVNEPSSLVIPGSTSEDSNTPSNQSTETPDRCDPQNTTSSNQFPTPQTKDEAGEGGPSDEEASFFGVWDGTVNPHASEFVHTRCCGHHLASQGFQRYIQLVRQGRNMAIDRQRASECLRQACMEGYAATDAQVIESCRLLNNHYSSTTSVTALIANGILTVAHLGDSRAMLLVEGGPSTRPSKGWFSGVFDTQSRSTAQAQASPRLPVLRGIQLTRDHKPDDLEERRRIEMSGGSIQLLHNHNMKPFIRGGDFERRKARGERVMQLQYSRAFGGKDLKPYGLSAEPSIKQLDLKPEHVGLVLASDGVCDVAGADDVAAVVGNAWARGEDAARELVYWAFQERRRVGVGNDNITALVVQFRPLVRAAGETNMKALEETFEGLDVAVRGYH